MNGLIYLGYFTELARYHFNIVLLCTLIFAVPGMVLVYQVQQRTINNYTLYWHQLDLLRKALWYLGYIGLLALLLFAVHVYAKRVYAEDLQEQCMWGCNSAQKWKLDRLGVKESDQDYPPLEF